MFFVLDIGHLISPQMKLVEYGDVIQNLLATQLIVRNVVNHWNRNGSSGKKASEFIPDEVCDLVVSFWPNINVRPIGLAKEREADDVSTWNEQMCNRRNEILSYIKD